MYVSATDLDQSVLVEGVYFHALDEVRLGIVLTPACDFAQHKVELALVCAMVDAWELIAALLPGDWRKMGLTREDGTLISKEEFGSTKRKTFENQVNQLMNQRFPRYHWLPPLPGTGSPLVADFQTLASVPVLELQTLPRLAAVESPFREEIPARYAAYVGRVGTPDISDDDRRRWLDLGAATLFRAS